jgi:hypothetical protein
MIRPSGGQPPAGLSATRVLVARVLAAWVLAALRAYLVFVVIINLYTPKTRYNDPSNKGILTKTKYFQSPSIFFNTPTVKISSNNEPLYSSALT